MKTKSTMCQNWWGAAKSVLGGSGVINGHIKNEEKLKQYKEKLNLYIKKLEE